MSERSLIIRVISILCPQATLPWVLVYKKRLTLTMKSTIKNIYCQNPLKLTASMEHSLGTTALHYILIVRIIYYMLHWSEKEQ
jgi:hypothetical protein